MSILQIGAVAIIGAVCAALLRRSNGELALLLVMAACAVLLLGISGVLREVAALLRELAQLAGVENDLLRPVLKTAGISIVTGLSAQLCRDAGAGSLALTTELCGTVCALYAALPLIEAVLGLISGLL